jgi:hypothetical protein
MLENFSFLALAGALTFAASMTGCFVATDDETQDVGDGDGDGETTGDGDGSTGDGDGDGGSTGDGDGDGGSTGDGDGDPTGDGDGDQTGDGDGDPGASCGWLSNVQPAGYYCGGEGVDPSGNVPYSCPGGLVEGEACGAVTGAGCCDANGDVWYCGEDGESTFIVFEAC